MNYDECLVENPFFKTIQQKYDYILERASLENWIICIPRTGTTKAACISEEDALKHVLVPRTNTTFVTLSNHEVFCTEDRRIIFDGGVSTVRMLFEETYYADKFTKYKLWCLECPVNSEICCDQTSMQVPVWCNDSHVVAVLKDFLMDDIRFDDLSVLRRKFSNLRAACTENFRNCERVVEIERYIEQHIQDKLFRAVCNCRCNDDAHFNRTVRNLAHIRLKDSQIHRRLYENVPRARCALAKLNKLPDVTSKLECLRCTFNVISSSVCHLQKGNAPKIVTSDDLIRVFVFLIIKSNLNNWLGNLTYISHFRFDPNLYNDENSFLITTLEAAVEFVSREMPLEDAPALPLPKDSNLSNLYGHVRNGNLNVLREILDGSSCPCQPLCACDKCRRLSSSRDDKGRTLLHVACSYGHFHMVEYFVSKRVDVDALDNSESTPLHYAASRGHQDILLFLLNAEANPSIADYEGNTTLHVASNRGHESCVKALLCFVERKNRNVSDYVNVQNNFGNTPLHFAAKWGHWGIACVLLQHAAAIDVPNGQNRTVLDVAHNDYMEGLLLRTGNIGKRTINFVYGTKDANSDNDEREKRINLLLKSIENDDLPLTCYYLGLPYSCCATIKRPKLMTTTTTCHPLCACDKCLKVFDANSRDVTRSSTLRDTVNVNVCNSEGYSVTHAAAKWGRFDILRVLLDRGASVNLKTKRDRRTPLHLACIHGQVQIVRELLKRGGCDTNVQDANGNLPLHHAYLNNHNDIVELLIKYGPSCSAGINLKS